MSKTIKPLDGDLEAAFYFLKKDIEELLPEAPTKSRNIRIAQAVEKAAGIGNLAILNGQDALPQLTEIRELAKEAISATKRHRENY